jgi:RNA polymerase sigma-70 factor (ECF subfamily)
MTTIDQRPSPPDVSTDDDERTLVQELRNGDEGAFMRVLHLYHGSMLRSARLFVRTDEIAKDVVQETWLAVLAGLPRYEGRASLRTWIHRILVNRAKSRGQREARTIALSVLADREAESIDPAVAAGHFWDDPARWSGHWRSEPRPWAASAEDESLAAELRAHLRGAIGRLPLVQRTVITLRDVEGWSARDVCEVLDVSEANQRVLLHRARSRVRRELGEYLHAG